MNLEKEVCEQAVGLVIAIYTSWRKSGLKWSNMLSNYVHNYQVCKYFHQQEFFFLNNCLKKKLSLLVKVLNWKCFGFEVELILAVAFRIFGSGVLFLWFFKVVDFSNHSQCYDELVYFLHHTSWLLVWTIVPFYPWSVDTVIYPHLWRSPSSDSDKRYLWISSVILVGIYTVFSGGIIC